MELLKKISFFIFVLFILLLFVWALYVPKKDVTDMIQSTLDEQKGKLDLFYKGVAFQETINGIKYWEIKAKTSSINKTTGIASLEETEGTFFRDKKPTLMFVAPYAVWKMNEREITLINPIGYDSKSKNSSVIASLQNKNGNYFQFPSSNDKKDKGFIFKAQKLVWSIKNKAIVCDKGLWIKKGEISGHAQRLKGDTSMEKIEISGNPVINIVNSNISTIEADKFLMDRNKDLIIASGKGTFKIDEIKGSTGKAIYNQKEKNLYLIDNVIIKYKDFKATSNQAKYNIFDQKIVLVDNSKLTRELSEVTGDSIEIDIKSKKVAILGKSRAIIPDKGLDKK